MSGIEWPAPPEPALLKLGPSSNVSARETAPIFKFDLLKEIGEGVFGRVFLARSSELSSSGTIAIKIVSSPTGSVDLKEPFILKSESWLFGLMIYVCAATRSNLTK